MVNKDIVFGRNILEIRDLLIFLRNNNRFESKSTTPADSNSAPHLDDKENDEACCTEHSAMNKVPTYSNKPNYVHVLPIPDLKRYENIFISNV